MKKTIKYFFLFILLYRAISPDSANAGKNNLLFKCEWKKGAESFSLQLDTVGKTILKKSQGDFCQLELSYLKSEPRAQNPGFSLSWTVSQCEGEMKKMEKKLLAKIKMRIDGLSQPAQGRVQWMKDEDISECLLPALKAEELHRRNHDWREGRWGSRKESLNQGADSRASLDTLSGLFDWDWAQHLKNKLVCATGFEPATSCTPSKCSTKLSHAQSSCKSLSERVGDCQTIATRMNAGLSREEGVFLQSGGLMLASRFHLFESEGVPDEPTKFDSLCLSF